jgi:hypothetical protein
MKETVIAVFLECVPVVGNLFCKLESSGFESCERLQPKIIFNKSKDRYYVILQNKKQMVNHAAWFYAEPCRGPKTCARRQ